MTTHDKTKRLARLIGLDYHASESKQKVWRQVKRSRPRGRSGAEWHKWHPYGLLEDYLIVENWVRREHPASSLACGCKVTMPVCYEQYCDAVLAAFDKPEPKPAVPTTPGAACFIRLRRREKRDAEPTELAEHHEATREMWRERAERAEAEAKRLQSYTYCAYCGEGHALDGDAVKVTQHIATCEKHPMRKVEAERDKLREQLADADRGVCCTAYKAQQRAEIERLTSDLAAMAADIQRFSAACDAAKQGRERSEAEVKRLQAVLDRITDGAEWCGIVREGVAINVCLWNLRNCDGRMGETLLEAATAAERGE